MSAAPSRSIAPSSGRGGWAVVAWIAVVAAGLLLLCSQWYGPDIWYHLALGDRILATHAVEPADALLVKPARFINVYWLFQITISSIHRLGGIEATSLFFIAGWGVAFGFWLKTSRGLSAGAWGAACLLSALLVCQPRFDPRPEVISYALLALQMYWLMTWDFSGPHAWRRIAGFAATEMVWAGVHGYFVFGPLLVGARLLAAIVEPASAPAGVSRRSQIRGLMVLLVATVLATVISPLGWRTWECVALLARALRELQGDVQEFFPPTKFNLRLWTVKLFWLYWLFVLFGTLVTLVRTPRRSFFAIATSIAGLVVSVMALRNLPLIVFLSAPVLGETLPRLPHGRRLGLALSGLVTLLAVSLGLWTIGGGFYESLRSVSAFGLGESPGAYPARFSRYLRAAHFDGKLFNAARDGGYLEYHAPNLRIYGDSRFVEPASVREYFAAVRDPAVFRRLDAVHHFDGALLPLDLGRDVLGTLLKDPEWKLACADLHRALLVRVTSSPTSTVAPFFELYHGEDLASAKHGAFAAQWIVILTLTDDRPHLVLALRQLAAAPVIPSFVGEFALRFAHGSGDREIVELVRSLRTRFLATTPDDQRQLDDAFAAVSTW